MEHAEQFFQDIQFSNESMSDFRVSQFRPDLFRRLMRFFIATQKLFPGNGSTLVT